MLKNIKMVITSRWLVLLTIVVLITSCAHERKTNADVSGITIHQEFLRFDKDLFSFGDTITVHDVKQLEQKYGSFIDLFCGRIIRVRNTGDSLVAADLSRFISDNDVKEIHHKTDSLFTDTKELQKNLLNVFKHYAFYFPDKPVPQIVTYISAFNYQVITGDSIIGIGLDMYLGESCADIYASINIPKYMFRRFTKDYIVSDCIKGWFQSEYDPDSVKSELLSQMIYQGKLLYYTDMLAPEMPDTIKTGYTKQQLDWCVKNESNVWAFFIEQKLLFSTVVQQYVKYINDGPTTNGLPKESPSKIGAWMGWQIVKSYMNNNPDITLQQLLNEKDAQKILNNSSYKPKQSS
jgi:gliding motility-associated lipoprotein GldB